jgi:hypothetical protein
MGDEAFAASIIVNWDRKQKQLTNSTSVHSLDYGDLGSIAPLEFRVKAGTASMNGGLVSGDRAPSEYDPSGSVLPAPTTSRFPLLVWEGPLTAGIEALVVSPSVWKRDILRDHLATYKQNWTNMSPSALMASPVVANQLLNPSLLSTVTKLADSVSNAPPSHTISGDLTKGYQIVETQFVQGNDRPIGLGRSGLNVVNYQDRFIVITQEKAASLKVGEGFTLPIFFAEPNSITTLGAVYTLFVRIDRLQ